MDFSMCFNINTIHTNSLDDTNPYLNIKLIMYFLF